MVLLVSVAFQCSFVTSVDRVACSSIFQVLISVRDVFNIYLCYLLTCQKTRSHIGNILVPIWRLELLVVVFQSSLLK